MKAKAKDYDGGKRDLLSVSFGVIQEFSRKGAKLFIDF